jgi:hypothetical protein
MANITTNINKTNNHLLPQTIEHKKTKTYGVRNPGPGFRHAHICGILTLPCW